VKRSPAEWAFRWIWNQPEVTVVLSGMNSQDMIDENIRVATDAEANTFTEKDFDLFEKASKILSEKIKIPCTGCNYCMPCPSGVDIPSCFSCYNDREIEGKALAVMKYIMQTNGHNASLCIKCGKCEQHCPQKIEIRQEIAKTSKTLEGITYKSLKFVMKNILKM